MEQVEKNVITSFDLAKKDILALRNKMAELVEVQEFLLRKVSRIENKPVVKTRIIKSKPKTITKTRTIVKTITKAAKKIFVASKEGKSFHLKTCPFAQNIKPKRKLVFKTKNAALNKGYKPCKCIK